MFLDIINNLAIAMVSMKLFLEVMGKKIA